VPSLLKITTPVLRSVLTRVDLGYVGGVARTLQTETTTLLAAMTVQPNAARKNLIDDCVIALKSAGVWTKLDFLYVHAAHDKQAGFVNWKTPSNVATEIPTLNFTTDRGFKSNGTSAYINTGLVESALTNFKQNDAHLAVWNLVTPAGSGTNDTVISELTTPRSIMSLNNVGSFSSRLQTAATQTASPASLIGHFCISRSLAASYDRYVNGTFFDTASTASSAPIAEAIVLLRSTTPVFANASQLAVSHGGAGLTAGEATSMYNALRTYLTGLGVP